MEVNHVKYTQVTPSEFPSKSQRQPPPSKADAVTTALISIFETRIIDILPALGFLFLTYSVVEALLKAKGNYGTISFVVCSYANLIALFYCLKSFEKLTEGESPKKRRLKIAVPRKRNRPQGSGGVPHPSTPPGAAYDEFKQSDLPINNIGGIVPLTDEPTLPVPSSENDYWKIFNFKCSWPCVVMPLFIVIVQMILRTTHKTVGDYPINL